MYHDKKLSCWTFLVLLATSVICANSAFGTNNYFRSTSGNWNTGGNWSTGSVPNTSSTWTQMGDSGTPNAHAIVNNTCPDVGGAVYVAVAYNGTLEVDSGGSINFNSSACFCVGENGATGTVNVYGGMLNVTNWAHFGDAGYAVWNQWGGTATIAYMNGWAVNGGTATFSLSGGTLIIPNGIGPATGVSITISGIGQYIVGGNHTSDLTLGGIVYPASGYVLNGSYNSTNNTTTITATTTVRSFLSGNGTWNLGSNWTSGTVPDIHSTLTYIGTVSSNPVKACVNNACPDVNGAVYVGVGYNGTIEVDSGGSINFVSGACLQVGENGATGTVNVYGGTLNVTNWALFGSGSGSNAVWNQWGGTATIAYMNGWALSGATATINICGGLLYIPNGFACNPGVNIYISGTGQYKVLYDQRGDLTLGGHVHAGTGLILCGSYDGTSTTITVTASVENFGYISGNWMTGSNWMSGAIPTTSTAYTYIGNSTRSWGRAIINSACPDIGGVIYLGLNYPGRLEIDPNGSINMNGVGFCVGENSGDGYVTVTGGTLTISNSGWAHLGDNAGAVWNQTGGTVNLLSMNHWATNGGSAAVFLSGGSLTIPNGTSSATDNPSNVCITISGTGQYIVSGDQRSDLTLGGIVHPGAGCSLSGSYAGGNTTITATALSTASSSYYVATNGLDTNPGTLSQPFATLEKARNTIRSHSLPSGGVTVYLRGGSYYRTTEFDVNQLDMGTSTNPITYAAYQSEVPRIIGGVKLDPNWFSVVTSSDPLWGRIPTAARPYVYVCNLSAHGITDYGTLLPRGWTGDAISAMELCFNGSMMQLARWPNSGFTTTASPGSTSFTYPGTEPSNWTTATDPWVEGYWYYNWADDYCHVSGINTGTKTISLSTAPYYGIASGYRWYGLNLLEELDTAGEYYIERSSPNAGRLYFYPPSSISGSEILVSTLGQNNENILKVSNTIGPGYATWPYVKLYLTFKGITFEMCRQDAIRVLDCNDVTFDTCTVRNTGDNGIYTSYTANIDIKNCTLYGIGNTAISLDGGNRYTLDSSGSHVRNNTIYNFARWERTYKPAINLSGCGHTVLNNLIYSAPHVGILFVGNNHDIEFNTIYNVCSETADCGAVYSGRDWGFRGNTISNNVVRDITSSIGPGAANAIYLDDCFSSATVHSNVIYNSDNYGLLINGGRDNDMQNNVIAKCGVAANATSMCGWISGMQSDLTTKIQQYSYNLAPWCVAYPALAAIFNAPGDCRNPAGNVLARSIGWSNGVYGWQYDTGYGGTGGFNYYTIFYNINDQNPLFVDETNRNLALQDTSPAYTISGFARIPFERIGNLLTTKACRPNPANALTGFTKTPTLYWGEAFNSTSRDVYFGTNQTNVLNATHASPEYKGNITTYQYAPGTLNATTTYYWRIDEYPNGTVGKGDVWSFTTGS
jgi:hypothetical protein